MASLAIITIAPIINNMPPEAVAIASPKMADIGQTIIFYALQSKESRVDFECIFHDGTKKHEKQCDMHLVHK